MPNYIKAYVFVVSIGFLCYVLWQRSVRIPILINGEGLKIHRESRQYFVAWVLLTTALFLSSNYYVFALISIIIILMMRKRMPAYAHGGLYIVLLLTVPTLQKTLPGFGGLNKLFEISWPMILGIAFIFTNRYGQIFSVRWKMDWVVVLFFLIISLLSFRTTTFTDGLRAGFLYFNLICVPYFVAKKLINNIDAVKFTFWGYAFVAVVLSGIVVFSSLRSWNLYVELVGPLDLSKSNITNYKFRSDFLRSGATLGSIQMAVVGSGALVVYIYLAGYFKKMISQKATLFLIASGVIFTFSRAPWIVGAGMVVFYLALRYKSKSLLYVVVGGGLFAGLLMASGLLDSVVSGFTLKDSGNVDYRRRLLELGAREVLKYPLFGNPHFMSAPDLQVLRQGEGIIDIVNTYLQIALQYGLIATALFVFAIVAWPTLLYRRAKKIGDVEIIGVAQVYWVVMLGMSAVIFTVSSLGVSSNFFTLLMFLVGVGHGIRKN